MNKEVLRILLENDPDGKPNRPTEADYDRFREWAIKRFGVTAYLYYMGNPWDEKKSLYE